MNNDLISRDDLKRAMQTEIANVPQPDTDADYYVGVKQGLKLAETLIDNAPTVENITVFTESTDEKSIADLKEELQKVIAEKRPQGEWYEYLDKGLLKARHGNYVVYDVDYLFKHLIRELNLLESTRQIKGGAE